MDGQLTILKYCRVYKQQIKTKNGSDRTNRYGPGPVQADDSMQLFISSSRERERERVHVNGGHREEKMEKKK